MGEARKSKIKAIRNRKVHDNRCDLRKWDESGERRRCTNCTKFFKLEELNPRNKCKKCWALEMSHYRKGTISEYKKLRKKRRDKVMEDYLKNGRKKCNTCFEIKNFEDFHKESKTYDGRQGKCIECTKEYNSSYNPYLKEYNVKKAREYYNHKRKTDPQFKLSLNLRNRLNTLVKSYLKNGKTVSNHSALNLIGIPIEDFVSYIESQFVKGYMNWENHGEVWELDHIKPISSYDLTQDDQLKECFNFKNYQPLFKLTTVIDGVEYIGNRNKSNKY